MVASYVQLLARRYTDKLDADANEFINFAVDGAKRMQTLINDLLTYSRVGTRSKPLILTDCELVLQDSLNNLQIAIAESGAIITHDTLPIVLGDNVHLSQLFQNLLSNAIKFRHRGEAPSIHIGAERRGAEWIISVHDNGIGIDLRHAERIFQIFQRLHTATNIRAPASAWPSARRLSNATAATSGSNPSPATAPLFCSRFRFPRSPLHDVQPLPPAFRNPAGRGQSGDVRLTREALSTTSISFRLHVVPDGVETVAFLRRQGPYTATRGPTSSCST